MNVSYSCDCGATMEAEDVTPAVAELLWGTFNTDHPHSEARADTRRQEIRAEAEKRWRENDDG